MDTDTINHVYQEFRVSKSEPSKMCDGMCDDACIIQQCSGVDKVILLINFAYCAKL